MRIFNYYLPSFPLHIHYEKVNDVTEALHNTLNTGNLIGLMEYSSCQWCVLQLLGD